MRFSDPHMGIVRLRTTGYNQDGSVVIAQVSTLPSIWKQIDFSIIWPFLIGLLTRRDILAVQAHAIDAEAKREAYFARSAPLGRTVLGRV